MIDPKKKAVKALKRKRKLAKRTKNERQQIASGNIIFFGKGKNKIALKKKPKKKAKKEKEIKPLPPYRAVKLTTKLDQLTLQIKNADPKDPKLASMKSRRDEIKRKLNK